MVCNSSASSPDSQVLTWGSKRKVSHNVGECISNFQYASTTQTKGLSTSLTLFNSGDVTLIVADIKSMDRILAPSINKDRQILNMTSDHLNASFS